MRLDYERMQELERLSSSENYIDGDEGIPTPRSFDIISEIIRNWIYHGNEENQRGVDLLMRVGILVEEPQERNIVTPFSMTSGN